jgi:hypothetical protein
MPHRRGQNPIILAVVVIVLATLAAGTIVLIVTGSTSALAALGALVTSVLAAFGAFYRGPISAGSADRLQFEAANESDSDAVQPGTGTVPDES